MPEPTLVPPDRPRTYLVISAHPDDADFGVAGTVAKLAREGSRVHYLLCTSGDAGGEDPAVPAEELVRLREEEQDAAGRILGLASTRYLRFRDGELEPNIALRKAIVRVLRQTRPEVVLCQDPRMLVNEEGTYLNHPDHRAAGQAALDAVFPASQNPRAFMELLAEKLEPHRVKEVWLYFTSPDKANHFVDITETLDTKVEALAAHASQIGDWASSGGLRAEIGQWATDTARRYNLPYTAAEGFQRLVLATDQEPEELPAAAQAAEAQAED